MKKLLFLLPLTLMALTGCNSNKVDNRVSDTPKETVTLSKKISLLMWRVIQA